MEKQIQQPSVNNKHNDKEEWTTTVANNNDYNEINSINGFYLIYKQN